MHKGKVCIGHTLADNICLLWIPVHYKNYQILIFYIYKHIQYNRYREKEMEETTPTPHAAASLSPRGLVCSDIFFFSSK